MSEDLEKRIRDLEKLAAQDQGKFALMEQRHQAHVEATEKQLDALVAWTEKKDARSEWLLRAVGGLIIAAIVAWALGGGLKLG